MRQPLNTPVAAAAAVPASSEPTTAESLGWQLRSALPPLRLHSVSLWDEQANTLWLSEGALGPDEHNVVLEATEALGNDTSLNCYETGIEDGPVAVCLPVRSPVGGLVGLAMILADVKSVDDNVLDKLASPQIRTVLQKVAVLLRPASQRASQTESLKVLELAPAVGVGPTSAPELGDRLVAVTAVPPTLTAAKAVAPMPPSLAAAETVALMPPTLAAAKAVTPVPPTLPAAKAVTPVPPTLAAAAPSTEQAAQPVLTPQAIDDMLEFELSPDVQPAAFAIHMQPASVPDNVTQFPVAAVATTNSNASSTATATSTAAVAVAAAAAAPSVVPTVKPAAITPPTIAPATITAPANTPPTITAADRATTASNSSSTMTSRTLTGTASTTTSRTLTGTASTMTSRTLTDTAKTLSATSTSKVIALPEGVNVILEILPFSKLRAGGRTRRFEVLPRSNQPNRVPQGFDKIALQQLLMWMGSNRAAWSLEPTSFTLNLSIATLEDDRFPQFVASNLKANGIAPDNIGFEIAEPLCVQRRAQVERFITLCDKLGCFVVIDDFTLDSSITSLLRSRALRLVKIDPKLTSVVLKDKLAQAMVVAIAQAVKVLGIHCSAKRVNTQAALQWMTAVGADFAQGAALAQLQPLESLGIEGAAAPSTPA